MIISVKLNVDLFHVFVLVKYKLCYLNVLPHRGRCEKTTGGPFKTPIAPYNYPQKHENTETQLSITSEDTNSPDSPVILSVHLFHRTGQQRQLTIIPS